MWAVFLKGLVLGFSIAAPVGPIGLLCIGKTLQHGRLSGLCSGLGAAAADTVYGIVAAFGLSLISGFLIDQALWLQFFGGLFLLYLGWHTFFAPITQKERPISHQALLNDFLSTFALTLTNPMTIFSYLAIFASLGFKRTESDFTHSVILVAGVFLGSALWWLLLSEGVTYFRHKMSDTVMRWINRFAGLLIAGFGLWALSGLLYF